MNLFGNGIKFGGAVVIGAAVVLLAPVVLPVIAGVLKPVAKGVIKGGLLAYEGAKVAMAETKETIEDIAAEAKAEISEGRKAPAKTKKQAA
jgi:Protein of unknown function (DUF5132)